MKRDDEGNLRVEVLQEGERVEAGFPDFDDVVAAAAARDGSNRIAAALLTLAVWTGGDTTNAPECGREDIVQTYRAMLREVTTGGK